MNQGMVKSKCMLVVVTASLLCMAATGNCHREDKRSAPQSPCMESEREAYVPVIRFILSLSNIGQRVFIDSGRGTVFEEELIRELSDMPVELIPAQRVAHNEDGTPIDPETGNRARIITVHILKWQDERTAKAAYSVSHGAEAEEGGSGIVSLTDGAWEFRVDHFWIH